MLDLALKGVEELTFLREDGQVEVVVVVRDEDLAGAVDADSDGVVGDALAADLSGVDALVVEDLDAVRPVVADEDFLLVVDDHAVRELQVLGATELVQHVAQLVEDDHAHDFTLDDDDAALAVNRDAARVLQDVRTELAHKLSVLVVDLHLMSRASLGHDDVARCLHDCDSVRVEQLTIALTALAELKFESPFLIEDLDAVIVGIGDDDVILRIYGYAAGLGELSLHYAKLPKLAVVDHLLALELGFGGIDVGGDQLRGEVDHGIGACGENIAILDDLHPRVRPLLVRVAHGIGRHEVEATVGGEPLGQRGWVEHVTVLHTRVLDVWCIVGSVTVGPCDWLRLGVARLLLALTDVAEGVADPDLNRLIVGHKLDVETVLRIQIGLIVHNTLKASLQHLLEDQYLSGACVLEQLFDEFAPLVEFLDGFLHALRDGTQRDLFCVVRPVQLLQSLGLPLLQHRAVEVIGIVDLILRFVVLYLQAVGCVLDAFRRSAQLVRLRFRLVHQRHDSLLEFSPVVLQVFALVTFRVLEGRALLTDGDVARLAEVFDQFVLVFAAADGLVDLDVVLAILQLAEREHSVTFETMHELVRHDAVRAQEIGTVETSRHRIRILTLAAGTVQRGAVCSHGLQNVAHGEIGQQTRDALRGQKRILTT